jgi:phosphomannomutase
MLSVSGLRGWIGRSLTPPVAGRFAAAFADWLKAERSTASPHVLLGRDSRPSGPMLEHAVVAALAAAGCRVTKLGIISTPAAAMMVSRTEADGGLVLTASHNPQPWNGIKPLRADGVAPPADQAQQIIDRYEAEAFDYVEVESLQPIEEDRTAPATHAQLIAEQLDVEAICAADLTVAVDSVCGAGGEEVKALLEALGVSLVPLHMDPTGWFPHPPEPVKAHLGELCETVAAQGAAVGFAQDPDADRLALVDETGRYIGEEYTLALCAMHLMGQSGAQRAEAPASAAACNLSTSRMIDDVAARAGATVYRTPVGEANVAAAMRAHHAPLGGEGNGGIIWDRIGQVRNSLLGVGLVLEMLALTGQPLSKLAGRLPSYAMVKHKVELGEEGMDVLGPRLQQAFAKQTIDTQDGIRLDWPDKWIHVRSSNTEPVLRLISEAPDEATAQALIDEVRRVLGV